MPKSAAEEEVTRLEREIVKNGKEEKDKKGFCLKNIPYTGQLYVIRTLPDGSCFFHAILRAIYAKYIASDVKKRKSITRDVRDSLAYNLSFKDASGTTLYSRLNDGKLINFGLEEYSLENMCKRLRSDLDVDTIYHEFVSSQFDIDIYFIKMVDGDVISPGWSQNGLRYKNRKSVFLACKPGHFDLLAVKGGEEGVYEAFFSPTHEFTIAVRERLEIITAKT